MPRCPVGFRSEKRLDEPMFKFKWKCPDEWNRDKITYEYRAPIAHRTAGETLRSRLHLLAKRTNNILMPVVLEE